MNFRIRTLARYCFAALLFVVCALAEDPKLALNERAYIASRIYAALSNFSHWQDVPGMDVEAAYRIYLEKALASDDRSAFSRASMEFLARFHNTHTMLLDRVLIDHGGPLPFTARFVDGKWVVTSSRSPRLSAGDVIESIDGEAFESFFSSRRRYISASTEPWARAALFGSQAPLFALYAHLLPEHFVLGLQGGQQVSIDRRTIAEKPLAGTEGRWLEPGKVAYIRIPSFMDPKYEKRAVELVREFRSAAGLIIDVRDNAGGNTPGQLISVLMDRPYRSPTESTPLTLPYFRILASRGSSDYEPFARPEFLWRASVQQPAKDSFKGKLALLVDAGCLSSCEDLTMPFKDNGRALIAGSTTGGSTGQPYMLDFDNGMLVLVGAKRVMFPDGSRFEGVGITPDLEISPHIEDIKNGTDVVLDAAMKELRGPKRP